jgi:uncharacterized damage-inducible protein DinB
LPGYEPEVGRWLWSMEEVRRRTLDSVKGLDQQTLDWEGPDDQENAIGSLLYHIALVEMSWLYMDILEQDLPPPVKADFPHDMASQGRVTRVPSVPLAGHLERLNRSRGVFLEAFRSMSLDDWGRLRSPGNVDYKVTPAWAVFHLVEHEAGHAAQIGALKARAARFFLGASMEDRGQKEALRRLTSRVQPTAD